MERHLCGTLQDGRVCISDEAAIHDISLDGYGQQCQDRYCLDPFEALYLMDTGCLTVTHNKKRMGFDVLLQVCQQDDSDILSKYLIYRDLRTRGYVAKDGFGFGADLCVYDRGEYGQKGARLLVFGLSEGRRISAGRFRRDVYQITGMGKEPVVAVIERRGEIIYYKINRMQFPGP